ncbi:phosphoribosylaminoimidazolesuccinocarboxamide synthase [candidate division GN15 bacterium]|uniref:Phosphoribosylaminoimidazole-succinocarboxamide synthase n=1 Tax=candidate division GN15 bacterium TaxID=2072418 RepID=A0A855X721_9BACT|nr:MAG: phosphoribosylaminoimidazolesuccinocarboxamide synthase [candidate division GN15 bacterium]
MENVVLTTDIKEYPLLRRGKVRDVYDLGDTLLFVASDRLSVFDVVMPNGIPGKGRVLTQTSLFWFDFLKDVVANHFVTASVDEYPHPLRKYRAELEGRSMIVVKAERVDAECIVRGYISGSMWKELVAARKVGSNTVHGFTFPADLQESGKLAEPLFTPSSKNDVGHDENISYDQLVKLVGKEIAQLCRDKSLAVYEKAADYALTKGIIIADTKFEFGFKDGKFILIDEVLSPDSSRFWPVDKYTVGQAQPSFDKQPIRDYLESTGWNKKPPAPNLPAEVISAAAVRYREAQKLLTGRG